MIKNTISSHNLIPTSASTHTLSSMSKDIKCVIIGDSAVGKTCMLERYATDSFPKGYTPTIFDNFSANLLANDVSISLGLWDTSGSYSYDRLRPLSYSDTQVFLLCFSLISPSSFKSIITKWNTEVIPFNKKAVKILVGTKLDLRDTDDTLATLRRKKLEPISYVEGLQMMNEIGASNYLECSARTKTGLNRVFEEAVSQVLMRRSYPKSQPQCKFL